MGTARRGVAPDQGVFMISVAAELASMHPQTLRMYEQRGLITPKRSAGGTRLYSERDVERLRRIQELTELGMNLAGVEKVFELEEQLERSRRKVASLERRAEELQAEMAAMERRTDELHAEIERLEARREQVRAELVRYEPVSTALVPVRALRSRRQWR